jgi:glycosyltransferase involved in cell wall biosynthesis
VTEQEVFVSVVVPTLGRVGLLANCLKVIDRQSYKNYELIVVHDGRNIESVRELVNSHGGRYVESPRSGVVPTYNAGLEASSGNVVAFTDDDAVPDPNWLLRLTASYVDGVGGVGGTIVEVTSPTKPAFRPKGVVTVDHLGGANMSFSRDAISSTGYFDYNYAGDGFRFESDYCARVGRNGFKILFDPSAIVTHYRSGLRRVPRRWNPKRAYYHTRNDIYFSLKNRLVAKTGNYAVQQTGKEMRMRIIRNARYMARRAFLGRDAIWLYSLAGLAAGVYAYRSGERKRGSLYLERRKPNYSKKLVIHTKRG